MSRPESWPCLYRFDTIRVGRDRTDQTDTHQLDLCGPPRSSDFSIERTIDTSHKGGH